jgi:hypothetical protein
MSKIRTNWFQRTAQQGVFMKVANLHVISKSGSIQSISNVVMPRNPDADKYFIVGKSVVGGKEVVGG